MLWFFLFIDAIATKKGAGWAFKKWQGTKKHGRIASVFFFPGSFGLVEVLKDLISLENSRLELK